MVLTRFQVGYSVQRLTFLNIALIAFAEADVEFVQRTTMFV